MKENKLYPLKFVRNEGGWLLADSLDVAEGWLEGNTLDDVMETYMDRVTGEMVFGCTGRQFPLMARTLQVDGSLPPMVCPDDLTASERYDSLGKMKVWYVISASEESTISIGLRNQLTAADFFNAAIEGSLDGHMQTFPAHAGDLFTIAPAQVHSACGRMKLLEISEASEADFVLGGDGDIFEAASECLDYVQLAPGSEPSGTPAFAARKMTLTDPLQVSMDEYDSFLLYAGVSGEAVLQIPSGNGGFDKHVLKAGEVILVPAEVPDFYLLPLTSDAVIIEATIENQLQIDSYTGEAVAPESSESSEAEPDPFKFRS